MVNLIVISIIFYWGGRVFLPPQTVGVSAVGRSFFGKTPFH